MEIWKSVLDWEGLYEVSNKGRFRSLPKQIIRSNGKVQTFKGKILSPSLDKEGYLQLSLAHEGLVVKKKAHRLVAESFIKRIPDNMEINHINGIKNDNRVENLEIVTKSQNILHAYSILGRDNCAYKLQKKICKYSIKPRKSQKSPAIKGELLAILDGINFASRDTGIIASSIQACLTGKQKTAGGFIWEYF